MHKCLSWKYFTIRTGGLRVSIDFLCGRADDELGRFESGFLVFPHNKAGAVSTTQRTTTSTALPYRISCLGFAPCSCAVRIPCRTRPRPCRGLVRALKVQIAVIDNEQEVMQALAAAN